MAAEPAAAYGGRNRLLRNIGSNYATAGAQAAFLVLATPYVIDRLGIAGFGGWAVILAVTGYLRLLDLGLGPRHGALRRRRTFPRRDQHRRLHGHRVADRRRGARPRRRRARDPPRPLAAA